MSHNQLGYTQKWWDYHFLTPSILQQQLEEYAKGEDGHTEHYRYWTFLNFLEGKEQLSQQEIEHFLELALEDSDSSMAGAVVKVLFCSSLLSPSQYQFIKSQLPNFGAWTEKLIARQDLQQQLQQVSSVSWELFQQCWAYREQFKENVLVELVLEKTDNQVILEFILQSTIGKKYKTKAAYKLQHLQNQS